MPYLQGLMYELINAVVRSVLRYLYTPGAVLQTLLKNIFNLS